MALRQLLSCAYLKGEGVAAKAAKSCFWLTMELMTVAGRGQACSIGTGSLLRETLVWRLFKVPPILSIKSQTE